MGNGRPWHSTCPACSTAWLQYNIWKLLVQYPTCPGEKPRRRLRRDELPSGLPAPMSPDGGGVMAGALAASLARRLTPEGTHALEPEILEACIQGGANQGIQGGANQLHGMRGDLAPFKDCAISCRLPPSVMYSLCTAEWTIVSDSGLGVAQYPPLCQEPRPCTMTSMT